MEALGIIYISYSPHEASPVLSYGYQGDVWDKWASPFCCICWSEDENLETDQNESFLSDICSNIWILSNVKRVQQEVSWVFSWGKI